MTLPRVLLLHTGGTLGMAGRRPGPLKPAAFAQALRRRVPELWRIARLEVEILANVDSSDMNPELWQTLARRIHHKLPGLTGVVVTHGTDTMAYTASALSFMLPGLRRPVILTGSQRPLAEVRTDARLNLIDAVTAATAGEELPEVAICFDSRLFRGNRARKQKIAEYDAFHSPNLPPLGGLGVDVTLAKRRRPRGPFRLLDRLETRILWVHAYPGLDPTPHLALLASGAIRGLLVSGFGAGNFPLTGPRSLLPLFAEAHARSLPTLVISQAQHNGVDLSMYESGAAARKLGAVGGGDITPEAAVVKLMHVLAYARGPAAAQRMLVRDLAGERS